MSSEKKESKTADDINSDFHVLFPGRKVGVDTAKGKLGFTIFPVAVEQMQRFSKGITKVFTALGTVKFLKNASLEEKAKVVLPAIIPIIFDDLLDLVSECCIPDKGFKITVMQLPGYRAVPVVEAWFDESFGSEEKLRPFVDVAERMYKRLSGKSVDLWGALSAFSSEQDIDLMTSSTDDSPDSPIEDGASPS